MTKDWIRKICKVLLIIIFFISISILFIYNIKQNDDFLKTPLYNILNFLIAIIVAYYLTQRKNDERKLKEKAEEIIGKIQLMLNEKRAYCITSEEDISYLLIMQRSISNRINILDGVKKELKFNDEITYIKDNFKSYKEIIGNHMNDIDYLSKSQKELENFILLIDNKLDEIRISMYK